MVMLATQTFLLLAIAFILGCLLGFFLKNIFGPKSSTDQYGSGDSDLALSSVAKAATAQETRPAAIADAKPVLQNAEKAKTLDEDITGLFPNKIEKPAEPKAAVAPAPAPKSSPNTNATKTKTASADPVNAVRSGKIAGGNINEPAKTTPQRRVVISRSSPIALKGKPEAAAAQSAPVAKDKEAVKDNASAVVNSGASISGTVGGKITPAASKVASVSKPTEPAKVPAKPTISKATIAKAADVAPVKPAQVIEPAADVIPEPKDDLKLIKGVGPQLETKLNNLGINYFSDIAKLTKKREAEIDEALKSAGRITRDKWVAQAKTLQKKKEDAAKRAALAAKRKLAADKKKAAAAAKKEAARIKAAEKKAIAKAKEAEKKALAKAKAAERAAAAKASGKTVRTKAAPAKKAAAAVAPDKKPAAKAAAVKKPAPKTAPAKKPAAKKASAKAAPAKKPVAKAKTSPAKAKIKALSKK